MANSSAFMWRNSGIGVPESSREMIFEKFTQLDGGITRRYSGTGLGLSIARNLARAMGGDVTIQASASGGSAFTVTLPLNRVMVEELQAAPASLEPTRTLSEMDVLMVEPNPIVQGGLRSVLERRVESLTFKPTIDDAINHMAASPVHLVIASLPRVGHEPQATTGADMRALVEAAADTGAHLTMIVNSAAAAAKSHPASRRLSHLERPVNAAKLLEHLEKLNSLQDSEPALLS